MTPAEFVLLFGGGLLVASAAGLAAERANDWRLRREQRRKTRNSKRVRRLMKRDARKPGGLIR